jgi:hypothetical protein
VSKTVVIHQPDFLPWLGFFHRFLHADLYVALDHVQFTRGTRHSWTHRDRIKTPSGVRWLSLSVQKAPLGTPIREIKLAPDAGWREANLNLLRESYGGARFFGEFFPLIEDLYRRQFSSLVDMTLASIDMLCGILGARLPVLRSSDLRPAGTSNEMLASLLCQTGATRYLSGLGARSYFDPAPFAAAGIEVVWQAFRHPVYPQLHGGPFEPALSAIDLLFNCGQEKASEILRSG